MDNSLNTMHISDNKYRDYEAARTAFFVLLVDDLDGKLLKPEYKGDPARASESDYLKTPQEALKLNVRYELNPFKVVSSIFPFTEL